MLQKNDLFFYAWLKHYTAVQMKNRTLLGRIFWFLENRETFHANFNTSLRFRGYCKNQIWSEVAMMDFRLRSTFYLRPILHSFLKELPSLRHRNKYFARQVSILHGRSSHFWSAGLAGAQVAPFKPADFQFNMAAAGNIHVFEIVSLIIHEL